MGLTQTHALGRSLKFFVNQEGTAGTFAKPATGDAAKVLKTNMNLAQERRPRLDSRTTRSLIERITGKGVVDWDVEAYLIPSGTAGTPPDLTDLFEMAMGTYTNTPGTSDAYTLSDSQTCLTASIIRHMNDVLMEATAGSWVETMEISATGGDEPKVKFAGGAMTHIHTGTSTLNGSMSSDQMIVQTADGWNFEDGSVVQIDADDNSGAGYEVTLDTSRPTFTIEASVTEGSGDAVVPYTPDETTTGSPINGITGSFTHNSDTLAVTAFTVTLANGIKPLGDEAQVQFVSDIIPGYRTVTGTMSVRARKDWIIHHADRKGFGQVALTVVLGSTAGAICTVSCPQIEVDFSAIEVPEAEEAVITLPFTALSSTATAKDELAVTFT